MACSPHCHVIALLKTQKLTLDAQLPNADRLGKTPYQSIDWAYVGGIFAQVSWLYGSYLNSSHRVGGVGAVVESNVLRPRFQS